MKDLPRIAFFLLLIAISVCIEMIKKPLQSGGIEEATKSETVST